MGCIWATFAGKSGRFQFLLHKIQIGRNWRLCPPPLLLISQIFFFFSILYGNLFLVAATCLVIAKGKKNETSPQIYPREFMFFCCLSSVSVCEGEPLSHAWRPASPAARGRPRSWPSTACTSCTAQGSARPHSASHARGGRVPAQVSAPLWDCCADTCGRDARPLRPSLWCPNQTHLSGENTLLNQAVLASLDLCLLSFLSCTSTELCTKGRSV